MSLLTRPSLDAAGRQGHAERCASSVGAQVGAGRGAAAASSGAATDYLLYLPQEYGQAARNWPLVLFLHGSGQRGDDLALVRHVGIPARIDAGRHLPFFQRQEMGNLGPRPTKTRGSSGGWHPSAAGVRCAATGQAVAPRPESKSLRCSARGQRLSAMRDVLAYAIGARTVRCNCAN